MPQQKQFERVKTIKGARSLWHVEENVLQVLLEHPYLDPTWIGEYLGAPVRVNKALSLLRARGYAERWTFTREQTALRSVWAITPEGVCALAEQRGIENAALERAFTYRRGRIVWLALNLERVTQVRRFVKLLEGLNPSNAGPRQSLAVAAVAAPLSPLWKWQIVAWQEEVQVESKPGKFTASIPFHGQVMLKQCEGERFVRCFIEYDNPNVPVPGQRERFARWLRAQRAQNTFDREGNLLTPALVVIAHDAYRLNEYIELFRRLALRYRFALPGIYLAAETEVDAARADPAQRIWYSIGVGARRTLLEDESGWTVELENPRWRPIVARVQGQTPILITPARQDRTRGVTLQEMAALNLALRLTDHKLMRWIAAHPLLSEQELAVLMPCDRAQVSKGLKKLVTLDLIEKKSAPSPDALREIAETMMDTRTLKHKMKTRYWVTTERGERYLAAIDGFGAALVQYRRAKLWSPEQTERLVRQWSHTRLSNLLFVKLAQASQSRGLELEWFSEAESRFYFSVNGERQAFLPDGRGTLNGNGRVVPFVLEMDTTRSNAGKIRRKLELYFAAVSERVLPENPNETPRILIITHSPDRMRHLIKTANEVAAQMDSENGSLRRIAPVLFAQQQTIVLPNVVIDRPVWTDLNGQRTYCFEEFSPVPSKPDTTRTGRVTYKS